MYKDEREYFSVRCCHDVFTSSRSTSEAFITGKTYRAKLATEREMSTRNVWIWIENDFRTSNGFSESFFNLYFVDVERVRGEKLNELGI